MHEQDFSKTVRLYYEDSEMKEFTGRVVSCEPAGDIWHIVLDRTAFFAEGGGQAGDVGELIWGAGCTDREAADEFTASNGCRTARVLDTHEKGGIIIHYTDAPIEAGSTVTGKLNWDVRFDRMQQHSAEHIISGLICQKFGYSNVGFHVGDDRTTLDFNGPVSAADLSNIELRANNIIYKRMPIKTFFPTKEEEKSLNYRSKIEIEGQVRIVQIDGVDICACCAPHVKDTGEIGIIKIIDAVNYKGGTRVSIVCGLRALRDYADRLSAVREISEMLSAPQAGVSQAVAELKSLSESRKSDIISWQDKYVSLLPMCEAGEVLLRFEEKLDMDAARKYVNAGAAAGAIVAAIFVGNDETGYHYCICSESIDIIAFTKTMNGALCGKGGGKPPMTQGSVGAGKEAIKNYFQLNLS